MTASKTPTAIDLFAGAGGLSLGLHEAGWNVHTALEYDKWCAETYKRNFPEADVLAVDVSTVDFTHYKGVDLVAGGPPCQPFSVAGKQLASADPRDMVPQFIRAVKEAKPRAFLMENVAGLLSARHRYYTMNAIHQLEDLGYSVYARVLDAASYGVPQHRKRVLLVGLPKGTPFKFPKPTHGPGASRPYFAAGQIIGREPVGEPNKAKITYAASPIMRPSPYAGMVVNGAGRPINLAAPSPTIPASAGGNRTHIVDIDGVLKDYHAYLRAGGTPKSGTVEGLRRLTLRESARLQSFPDSFTFSGPQSRQYSQVGNAVPPALGHAIGKSIYDALFRADAAVKNSVEIDDSMQLALVI